MLIGEFAEHSLRQPRGQIGSATERDDRGGGALDRARALVVQTGIAQQSALQPMSANPSEAVDEFPELDAWLASGEASAALGGIVDLRPASEYAAEHCASCTSIPWPHFATRLLPPRGAKLVVVVPDYRGAEVDDAQAQLACDEAVRAMGEHYCLTLVTSWSHFRSLPAVRARLVHNSASSVVLWRPNPCLSEALDSLGVSPAPGDAGLVAVDLACGCGRDVVGLALRGWRAVGVDCSEENLERARSLAELHGVTAGVALVRGDIEATPLDDVLGAWAAPQLVCMCRFLYRPLFDSIRRIVRPGGVFVLHTFTDGCRAFGKPRKAKHMVTAGELARAFIGWQVLLDDVRPVEDGRPCCYFVARKPFEADAAQLP